MRVSKEKAAENRERILKAASRLIRERGISGAGVDALTEAAGLTHGSLYSQFGSKDYGIADIAQRMDGAATLGDYISNYLSGSHRDTPGRGCPFAALSCEMPRQSSAVRRRFTDGLREITKRLTSRMGHRLKPRQRYEEALAMVSSLVGALVLARAVNDHKLSDDILRAARRRSKG
jgi:TetR/AcrR family transcriptional repressor of nem operon